MLDLGHNVLKFFLSFILKNVIAPEFLRHRPFLGVDSNLGRLNRAIARLCVKAEPVSYRTDGAESGEVAFGYKLNAVNS